MGVLLMLTSSCSKSDNTDNPTQSGTVTDIDGNVYHTVTIGTQVWMVENLKTTKYRNGDLIPNIINNASWIIINPHCSQKWLDMLKFNKIELFQKYFPLCNITTT